MRIGNKWRDAEVVASPVAPSSALHRLKVDGQPAELEIELAPFNHGPSVLPAASFETLWQRHCRTMRAQHASIIDALSGRRLDTLAHCVPIELSRSGARGSRSAEGPDQHVQDVTGLSRWLCDAHRRRLEGDVAAPTCVLLTAGPAAGKTCLMSQLVMHVIPSASSGESGAPTAEIAAHELVPILIKVQYLQKRLLSEPEMFSKAWNWVDAHLRQLHGESSEMYRFLRQALMARRALLLLDGIDEGGTERERIERHLTEVLAPQGHILMLTSRPNGINERRFSADGFHTIQLLPLTDGQQQSVIEKRLGVDSDEGARRAATLLMHYIRTKVPKDVETGARVTGNPLMLSMVLSIYQSQQAAADADADGVPSEDAVAMAAERMPKTITELYRVASSAMLDRLEMKQRGGGDDDTMATQLRQLLEAVFFEAHAAERRIIHPADIETAALALELPEALASIRAAHAQPGAERRAAIRAACEANLPPGKREAVQVMQERVQADRLPLLNLVQASPLEMQSSHLSFQEFFAATAICHGFELPP